MTESRKILSNFPKNLQLNPGSRYFYYLAKQRRAFLREHI